MTGWVVAAALALLAPAAAGRAASEAPAGPNQCVPAPDAICAQVTPEQVKADYEDALRLMRLDPVPRVEVSRDADFVTFDCAKNQVAAGGSNTEYKECGGQGVISAGRALAQMAMPCPRLEVYDAKEVRQAWAFHEGGHAQKKHLECRLKEVQRACIDWSSTRTGRDTAATLLARLRVASIDELSQAQRPIFRDQYLALCIKAKEVEEPLLAKWRDMEREADLVAMEYGGTNAFICAMQGADLYMKATGLQESDDHDPVSRRLLDGELQRMSLQLSSDPF